MDVFVIALIILLSSTQLVFTEDPQLFILVTDYKAPGIYRIDIHKFIIKRINVDVVAPLAIDYDHKDGLIYFTDIMTKQIRRVDMDGRYDTEVLKFNSSSKPDGLALDKETRQVFYTDSGNDAIGVVNMETFDHKIIIDTSLDKPRGIVADTKNKKIYWVDYGSDKKIETSDYNGDQRSVVVSSRLGVPLDITLDQDAGRLYWTDGVGAVGSVDVDGGNRRTFAVHNNDTLNLISFFNDFLYYTDLFDKSLFITPLEGDSYFIINPPFLQTPGGLHAFSPNFEITGKCQAGFYGRNCTKCGACYNNLLCEKTTGVCINSCQPGYTSLQCNKKCSPGTFGENCDSDCNCRRNGLCDPATGRCSDGCAIGWRGDNCSLECTPGTFGEDCRSNCNCKWNGVCDSISGKCSDGCAIGWKGDNCSVECGHGTFGEDCRSKCPTSCKENTICDAISGKCPLGCKSGWKGDYCTVGEGLPIVDIVGIVIGVLLFIVVTIALIVIAVFLLRRRNSTQNQNDFAIGVNNPVYENKGF